MGVLLRQAWSKSQWTVLMGYLTISTNVRRYQTHHRWQFFFQEDSAQCDGRHSNGKSSWWLEHKLHVYVDIHTFFGLMLSKWMKLDICFNTQWVFEHSFHWRSFYTFILERFVHFHLVFVIIASNLQGSHSLTWLLENFEIPNQSSSISVQWSYP